MLEIYVEPSSLAIPNMGSTATEAELLIERLISISRAISERTPVRLVSTMRLDDELSESYPTRELIRDFIDVFSLESYSPNDIFKAFQIVLSRIEYCAEDDFGEVSAGALSTDFAAVLSAPPGEKPTSLHTSVMNCMFRVSNGAKCLLLSPALSVPSGALVGSASVCEAIVAGKQSKLRSPLDDVTFQVISSIEDAESQAVASSLWSSSRTEQDLASAIWFGARATQRELNLARIPLRFGIGGEFLASLELYGALRGGPFESTTSRVCYRAVAGPSLVQFQAFRDRPRRGHDGALPLRAQINTGNPAMRIMAWQIDAQMVEFANIGPKKELKILDGMSGRLLVN